MNNICLVGRLTKDPELKTLSTGSKYTRFTLAVSRIGAKDDQQKVDFIPCLAWQKTAEIICNYCSKGKLVSVNGRLAVTDYESFEGEKKKAFDVVVNNIEMLGGKSESKPESKSQETEYIDDNGLPFPLEDA